MPAVPWSCRIRRTRILLLFSTNLERFARLYSLRRHTRVNKRHAGWSRENSERNCCLHLSTSGAARGGPDRDRQRAARPCRWFRHDRNFYNPGQQDAENGTLLQRVRTQLETSFFGLTGEASARSGCIPGFSSPSRQKRLLARTAGDRVRSRLGVAVNSLGRRGRRPLCRHPKPSLAFSKPRFMWRNYSRTLNNPRAIEDRPAEM